MEKPAIWIGSSLEDLKDFPEDVKDEMGHAIGLAQAGKKYIGAKPLKGFGGAGVLEVVSDHDGDTFRAVYTVKFETPQGCRGALRGRTGRGGEDMKQPERVTVGSGNVFADLGVANPELALLKSRLAAELAEIIAAMGLLNDQGKVADILGIDQPKVSKLLRGRLKDFSEQRLMKFLTLLGSTVEIVVHPPKKPKGARIKRGKLQVVHARA